MGKGDRRTKRGKIIQGSFGKTRPKFNKGAAETAAKKAESAPKKAAAKKKAPKKAAKK